MKIQIGQYTISEGGYGGEPDKINIVTENGEGGDFPLLLFEEAVDEFYKKNF